MIVLAERHKQHNRAPVPPRWLRGCVHAPNRARNALLDEDRIPLFRQQEWNRHVGPEADFRCGQQSTASRMSWRASSKFFTTPSRCHTASGWSFFSWWAALVPIPRSQPRNAFGCA